MYRKRRLTYIIIFIFVPCIILPLIYLSFFFYEFKSRVFNEISFTAETEEGESYNLRARYDRDKLIYRVNIPENISLKDIVINTAERGVFEINDAVYENGDTIENIDYNTEYDIKMYTEDGKLLNEASLIFIFETKGMAFNYNPDDENVNIISAPEDGRLSNPEGMNRHNQNGFIGGRKGFGNFRQRRPLPVYKIGLGLVFGVCCLYLLYKQIIASGGFKKGGRRK